VPWKFDPFEEEIIWVSSVLITDDVGDIDMGDVVEADMVIDLGNREDSPSQIDQGMRVYDGDI
jgi:hypothetical protein